MTEDPDPPPSRIEADSLGEAEIPADVLWGIHTWRAMNNFGYSSRRLPASLVRSVLTVKRAAAVTNMELGYLNQEVGRWIILACDSLLELDEGALMVHFPVDGFQGGAGTSTNMNVNEVVANKALVLMGKSPGEYGTIHPLQHVNLHGSTNDLIPTALRLAVTRSLQALEKGFLGLEAVLKEKQEAFASILKMGRTEMQTAVPMTLGQEFSAFAAAVGRDVLRMRAAQDRVRRINLGGTAIGTGLTAPLDYIHRVGGILANSSGINLAMSKNPIDGTANADSFAEVSGFVKSAAVNIGKISSDLRLLHFIGEIQLPAAQVGSSIMPGKVNPVVMEAAMQVSIAIRTNDVAISECAARGSLQINEFLPMIGWCLLDSIEMLSNFLPKFARHIEGIVADESKCSEHLDDSPTLVTALLPYIGYDRSAELLKELKKRRETGEDGVTLRQHLEEALGEEMINEALSINSMVKFGENPEIERRAAGERRIHPRD